MRSHIAEGMTVTGDIDGDIDLLLDGKLEGNLRCRAVTIGKLGSLIGKISAQEAFIDGRIEGDIDAKSVHLNETAVVIGDVRHEVVEVAAGARIEGHYSRSEELQKIEAPKDPPVSAGVTISAAVQDEDDETSTDADDEDRDGADVVTLGPSSKVG
ncbi:polymer-forming cytoskeletal protein [Rhodospirillaceae bacterium KN72]|uniref:Polymer-forming cytoskeletal protein n=1 Tax=Pacificispira spongiicola TaxID=2729598 RepID=A0A7Y0DZ60_9PROT|nr:polymer-forming cytoskeletal protein [Pacificispira spongiicola]NMM43516.1 polymer-forming cytoskeletal protein [Pacificispira spongiicola]